MPEGSSCRIRLESGSGAGSPDPVYPRPFRSRRRNRHGRGLRGELLPAHLAGSRTRAERFDEWVMESAQRLERLWGEDIQSYQFVVQEIPEGLEELLRRGGSIPLAAAAPGNGPKPPVITIYRRPVESTARGLVPVSELIHDVVVEQLASLMNMDPETIDPTYGRFRPL
ncbi:MULTISPECIES: metallopeptidase family protein [Arthrobacter]|uniref:Metallopeptidase family protein n=1 Tax=Arthrobacter caoxuetaonis TaxID=2886935 RepID=A0A9X1MC10_9MICC|nr:MULTISPECIES: metallopeptidase family protein [Arthrobacter]MCC3282324.1 metallopeptidase family protein [Arthrobacter caoxuetaonis]MCC3297288.1 metallopeptidase family protein [Arthrobacter caoxuetaonis]MCC9194177.1 metallopeptidase family protein [Arthrobacter sp. zg-Y916]USQ58160.1 metallopeptidase family protein [Arthrobacter caoxuetaonis]